MAQSQAGKPAGSMSSSAGRLQEGKENAAAKNLPMFDPSGKVLAAATSAPAWHDSKAARPGERCDAISKLPLADAAFRGSMTGTKILQPWQKGESLPDGGMTH